MSTSCLICDRLNLIKRNENPYHVCELKTGHVVIGDFQYFKGYTLFLCKQHIPELHLLDSDYKIQFLTEMSIVAEAVYTCFKPDKLNCLEILNLICIGTYFRDFSTRPIPINRSGVLTKVSDTLMLRDQMKAIYMN